MTPQIEYVHVIAYSVSFSLCKYCFPALYVIR